MAAFFSLLSRLFSGTSSDGEYQTTEIYRGLRNQVLTLSFKQLGVAEDEKVLAVLMETGYPEAVATLVSVVDGTASLYFSNGGGIIGAGDGEHEQAKEASRQLIHTARSCLNQMTVTNVFPLTRQGFTRFYVITPKGVWTSEIKENDLGENRSKLSPLFYAGQDLITQIRLIDQKKTN